MKTKIVIYLFFFAFSHEVWSLEVENNSYKRAFDMEQMKISSESYIASGIKYDMEKTSDGSTIIKGYYYDSDLIKFIDLYSTYHLEKTEYYSKTGEKVFERFYKYNSYGNISLVETYARNESIELDYYARNHFEYAGKEIQCNYYVQYSLVRQGKLEKCHCVGNVLANDILNPLFGKSQAIVFNENDTKVLEVSEKWKYKKNGYDYSCYVNGEKKCTYSMSSKEGTTIKKEIFDKNIILYKELQKVQNGTVSVSKSFNKNDQTNSGVCCHYDENYKEFQYGDVRIIHLGDEKIILENEKKKTDNLSMPLEFFFDRYLAMDFTLYE